MRISMKLKYYMRGLGIGIILTTLIFTIGNPKEKLSDDEVRQRAEALGMVTKEDSSSGLDKILDNAKLTVTSAPSDSPIIPTKEPTPTATPTAKPTQEPTKAPTPKPTHQPTAVPKPTKAAGETATKVSFTIKSGMSSGEVAIVLKEAGLVTNADAFNQYIVKSGKASIIRVGSYSIPSDATYDEIIKMITTK